MLDTEWLKAALNQSADIMSPSALQASIDFINANAELRMAVADVPADEAAMNFWARKEIATENGRSFAGVDKLIDVLRQREGSRVAMVTVTDGHQTFVAVLDGPEQRLAAAALLI